MFFSCYIRESLHLLYYIYPPYDLLYYIYPLWYCLLYYIYPSWFKFMCPARAYKAKWRISSPQHASRRVMVTGYRVHTGEAYRSQYGLGLRHPALGSCQKCVSFLILGGPRPNKDSCISGYIGVTPRSENTSFDSQQQNARGTGHLLISNCDKCQYL